MLPHYSSQNLLFAELLHRFVYIKDSPYILFPLLIPLLLWLIGKNFFKGKGAFVLPTVLLLSPWFWYLAFGHSFYIFFFFLTLIVIHGLLLIKLKKDAFGNILVIIASSFAMYSSAIFLFFLPLSLSTLLFTKILTIKQIRVSLIAIFILALPLVLLINVRRGEFLNKLVYEAKIFSDPGLINSINRYQGAAQDAGHKNLARISENKYLFFSEYTVLKYTSQIMPDTFFTSRYRLLGFSFSPPILLGFGIPFIYGLYLLLKDQKIRKLIFTSTILVVPSILANDMVSLNRLVLFSPVIYFIITKGLIYLYDFRRQRPQRLLLILTTVLIIFQLTVILFDVRTREQARFERYFGDKYALIEP